MIVTRQIEERHKALAAEHPHGVGVDDLHAAVHARPELAGAAIFTCFDAQARPVRYEILLADGTRLVQADPQ